MILMLKKKGEGNETWKICKSYGGWQISFFFFFLEWGLAYSWLLSFKWRKRPSAMFGAFTELMVTYLDWYEFLFGQDVRLLCPPTAVNSTFYLADKLKMASEKIARNPSLGNKRTKNVEILLNTLKHLILNIQLDLQNLKNDFEVFVNANDRYCKN